MDNDARVEETKAHVKDLAAANMLGVIAVLAFVFGLVVFVLVTFAPIKLPGGHALAMVFMSTAYIAKQGEIVRLRRIVASMAV